MMVEFFKFASHLMYSVWILDSIHNWPILKCTYFANLIRESLQTRHIQWKFSKVGQKILISNKILDHFCLKNIFSPTIKLGVKKFVIKLNLVSSLSNFLFFFKYEIRLHYNYFMIIIILYLLINTQKKKWTRKQFTYIILDKMILSIKKTMVKCLFC